MTENSRHRLAGRTEEGELKDMTDATDQKIENIIDATATATDETTEEKAAATEDATAPACDCCCGVHMGEADGKTVDESAPETGADCECGEQVEYDEPVAHECECHDTDTGTDTDKSRAEAVKEKAAEAIETAGEAVSKAGEALTTAAHAAASEFDADETKEAAKHVVDGAATVGKNVAGVVKKFVSTLVSKGGKDDTDGVKTDEAKGE